MTDAEIAAALLNGGHLGDPRKVPCPCGVMRSVMPAFHRAQQSDGDLRPRPGEYSDSRDSYHDCVHHPRRSCGTCRAADRMLAGVEARLYAEATYGPFEIC